MPARSPRSSRLISVVVLLLVIAGLAVWLSKAPAPALPGAMSVGGAEPSSARGGADRSSLPERSPRDAGRPAAPAARTELARPAAAPGAPPPRPLGAPPADRPMPTDRRGGLNPRAQQELEILSYGFETLDEDLQACLDQWAALDPKQTPEVMIGFELDRSGLTRSFLEGGDDVPFGPRTCLASAVYGLDWSNIVDQPAKVTRRFTITARDAGT